MPARWHPQRAPLERKIQQQICEYFEGLGCVAIAAGKQQHGGSARYQVKDLPDVVTILPWSQAMVVEVKRRASNYGLSLGQARFIVKLHRRAPRTVILVARSLEDVSDAIGAALMRGFRHEVDTWDLAAPYTLAAVQEAQRVIAKPAQEAVAKMGARR